MPRPKQPRLAAPGPHPGGGVRGAWGAARGDELVHLDRGYDSRLTRERLAELGLSWEISGKGKPAPFWASRLVGGRADELLALAKLAHKKLL